MRLKVGNSYLTRDGRKATIIEYNRHSDWPFISDLIDKKHGNDPVTYREDGSGGFDPNSKFEFDLIAELGEGSLGTQQLKNSVEEIRWDIQLRDRIAISAMQAIISNSANNEPLTIGIAEKSDNEKVSIISYSLADAMLKARKGSE